MPISHIKMRFFCQVLLCAVATVLFLDNLKTVSASSALRTKREDKYTTRYDNFDVSGILASRRLVKVYVNCLLNKGPCTPEGKELKKYIPDAIATACRKCSQLQKERVGLVLSHLLLNFRDDFYALAELYDPDGKARKMYNLDQDDMDYQDLEEA